MSNHASLTDSIIEELAKVHRSPFGECRSIFRVHEKFRRINEDAYNPQLVSIGPYHFGRSSLKVMEDHKLLYMAELLARTSDKEAKVEDSVNSIQSIQEEARNCYSESIYLNDDESTRMMIVDGLFIIELFLKCAKEVEVNRGGPIFSNLWVMSSLVHDLLLFENQLPMIVLTKLFQITMPKKGCKSLNELAVIFFDPLMPRPKNVLQKCINREGKHLLHLLSNTFSKSISSNNHQDAISNNSLEERCVPSVMELQRVGVRFKKRIDAGSFLDIRFTNGVLEIPRLLIQDQTETLLRNLIACEQYCGEVSYMTSYASLMDSLIASSSDVVILRKEGIITNWVGDDEYLLSFFKKLCAEVTLVNFQYADLCDELNTFYRKRWNPWLTDLHRDLQTPWKIISIIVVALLLLFTCGSFIFAVLSFFVRKP